MNCVVYFVQKNTKTFNYNRKDDISHIIVQIVDRFLTVLNLVLPYGTSIKSGCKKALSSSIYVLKTEQYLF